MPTPRNREEVINTQLALVVSTRFAHRVRSIRSSRSDGFFRFRLQILKRAIEGHNAWAIMAKGERYKEPAALVA
jgi:hypothetical protein